MHQQPSISRNQQPSLPDCKSVGRDYDSILKTQLGPVVIDNGRRWRRKKNNRFLK
jgi:hypothetical protein